MCDELKLHCGQCGKAMVAEGNFNKTSTKSAVENRSGYNYICKDCNRDNGVIKAGKKRGIEGQEKHIMNALRVLNLNLTALNKLYEKEGVGDITSIEDKLKLLLNHNNEVPFTKI